MASNYTINALTVAPAGGLIVPTMQIAVYKALYHSRLPFRGYLAQNAQWSHYQKHTFFHFSELNFTNFYPIGVACSLK